jgi:hypothetical protein
MKLAIRQAAVTLALARGETLSLDDARGVRIGARSGVLWVTQERGDGDHFVRPGGHLTVTSAGRTVVEALDHGFVQLSSAPRRFRADARAGTLRLRAGHSRSEVTLLSNDFVRADQHRFGHRHSECLRGLQVDGQVEFRQLLERQIARLRAAKQLADKVRQAIVRIGKFDAV